MDLLKLFRKKDATPVKRTFYICKMEYSMKAPKKKHVYYGVENNFLHFYFASAVPQGQIVCSYASYSELSAITSFVADNKEGPWKLPLLALN